MRRGLGVVISTLFAGLALAGFAVPASAHTAVYGDELESFAIDYTVSADGVLHVKETIEYDFEGSDRHGIYRDLVIREPYQDDKSKDQKYEVSNIAVHSTDASDQFTTETARYHAGRDQTLRIKIGSKGRTIWSGSATYEISYDVRGALRHFEDHSELYWDATGSAWDAMINNVTVKVAVPQGVQQAACFRGAAGSTTTCEKASVTDGVALFADSELAGKSQLTIVAGIKAGAVQNDGPIVVGPPNWLERAGMSWIALAVSVLVTAAAAALGVVYYRIGHRDQRYAGVPPGTGPPEGASVPVGKDTLTEDQLPVAFAPPAVAVAEGALMVDATAKPTSVAATLIDLAVRGGIRLDNTLDNTDDTDTDTDGTGGVRKAVLVDPEVAATNHEKALLKGLFPAMEAGDERPLERAAVGDFTLVRAADSMIDTLWSQIRERRWYRRLPAASGTGDGSTGAEWMIAITLSIALVLIGVWVGQIGSGQATSGRVMAIVVPVSALLIPLWMWVSRLRRGQRTAAGRAVADQVIGFRTYIATAEAEQLRFEEGEDIFSKYLPWAIAFGLASRWQRVCAELVQAGRLTPDPAWYAGPSYYHSDWSAASVSTAVQTTFAPPPPLTPGSGSGGGSSSGFSSYSGSSSAGSSGGGGGGGGGGSW